MTILTENFQETNEGDALFRQYHMLTDMYESPFATFHSVEKDRDVLARFCTETGVMYVGAVPVAVPIEKSEEINNVERCIRMVERIDGEASNASIFAATVSGQAIVANLESIRQGGNEPRLYIYTEYDLGSPGQELLEQGGKYGFKVHGLFNEKTKTEAGINFFEARAVVENPSDERISLSDVVDLGRVIRYAVQEDGSTLAIKKGGDFTPAETEQLWRLFRSRFEDISENLPIRMEESYEATMSLFNDPNYVFSYNIELDGTISCAAFASDVRSAYPWISEDFLDTIDHEYTEANGSQPYSLFVPGVAAYKKRGMSVSDRVLQNLVDCAALTGNPEVLFRFECTDVSSLYIPRIVEKVLRSNQQVSFVNRRMLGSKKYILLEVQTAPTEEQ